MNNKTKIKRTVLIVSMLAMVMALPASAVEFADSTIAVGTKNLVSDVTTYLTVLSPLVGGLFAVYFAIRRAGADEADKKMWGGRITNAIVCGVGGMLVLGVISLISGYYL